MVKKLKDILLNVKYGAKKDFSGLGVIIYSDVASLPIFPLRDTKPTISSDNIVNSLIELSSLTSEYHDGFHLLSENLELTHVSQYFSPPIISNVEVNRNKLFGGRYLAALFGSCLSGVIYTGITSNGFGTAIFQGGKEIIFVKDK